MAKALALVRKPGFSFSQAISPHPERANINIDRACLQHQHYIAALEEIGLDVIRFPPLENSPDAPFVEDTTVVFDHVAVACSSKEKSRQKESVSIHSEIKKYRQLKKE